MTPQRTCIGCRATGGPDDLLRLVVAGDRVVVDERRQLPGRGAWLHPSRDCFVLAGRRRAWARALRVDGPLDVSAVEAGLESPV